MSDKPLADPPLRTPVFHILLALTTGDLHGLGIAEEVDGATGGTVELGPGTLYRSLKEMTEARLVREVESPEDADPRRKYYGITAEGRIAVTAEVERLAGIVELARARDLRPGTA